MTAVAAASPERIAASASIPLGPTQSPANASPRTTGHVGGCAATDAMGRDAGMITAHHRPGHEAGIDDVVLPVRLHDVEGVLEERSMVVALFARTEVPSDVQHRAVRGSDVSDRALDGQVHGHVESEDVGEAWLAAVVGGRRPDGPCAPGRCRRRSLGDAPQAAPCEQPGDAARLVHCDDHGIGVEAVSVGEPDGVNPLVVVLHRRHRRTRPQLAARRPHDVGQSVHERGPAVVEVEDAVARQPEL